MLQHQFAELEEQFSQIKNFDHSLYSTHRFSQDLSTEQGNFKVQSDSQAVEILSRRISGY